MNEVDTIPGRKKLPAGFTAPAPAQAPLHAPLPASQPAPVPSPAPSPTLDPTAALKEENERLKARLAAVEAREQLASVMAGKGMETPTATGPLSRYRIRLPGLNPRVVDDQGRVHYPDYMDVSARSKPEAFAEFVRLNGISSTIQTPVIEELPG